jgi:hypothetical protein
MIGLAPVGGHQPPPAAPTHEPADQSGGPCAGSASRFGACAGVRQALRDRCTPLPADVRGASHGEQPVAGVRAMDGPSGTASPRLVFARSTLAMPPAIGARRDRVGQHVLSSHARGPSPHELPAVWTTVGPHGHTHVVGPQVAEQAMQTPVLFEGLEDQAEDALGLLVWGPLRIAVGAPDIPQGGDESAGHRAAPCGASLPTSGLACDRVPLRSSSHAARTGSERCSLSDQRGHRHQPTTSARWHSVRAMDASPCSNEPSDSSPAHGAARHGPS